LRDIATSYFKQAKRMYSATSPNEMKKFSATLAFFQKYGQQYGFDGLMLVAQGYQESQLDQSTRSPVGAIGLMQLMPLTGKEMGVGSFAQAEANVHAGTKYMRLLIDQYLTDATLDEQNRTLFAFACYNAGPNRIAQLRKEAKGTGLDENIWFDNVERVAAHRIGQETVQYVRNIYKYYIGYKLLLDSEQRQTAAKMPIMTAPTGEAGPAN
jgi:membrane-bound lytic murein transglycosylase MltF